MAPKIEDGDWAEYRRLVLAELERLNLQLENQKLEIERIKLTNAEHKIKLGLIGVVAGSIPIIVTTLLQYILGK